MISSFMYRFAGCLSVFHSNAHEYATDVFIPGDENHCHCPIGVGVGIGIGVEKIPELSADSDPDPEGKRAGGVWQSI
jgi:hypothetical protein